MAEGKKSFLLYCDLIHTVKKMPTEKAGELFKHILEYVNDMNPQTDDLIIQLVFEPIKQQLKRDLNKWESEIDKKSNSGKLGNLKRWNIDLYDLVVSNKMTIEEAEKVAQSRKESQNIAPRQNESHPVANIAVNDNVNVNVTVNDNDNDNVKEIKKEREIKGNKKEIEESEGEEKNKSVLMSDAIATDYNLSFLKYFDINSKKDVGIFEMAKTIYELIKHNEKYLDVTWVHLKKSKAQKFYDDVRNAVDNDKRTWKDFQTVNQFLKEHHFWASQVRSSETYRSKMDTMLGQSQSVLKTPLKSKIDKTTLRSTPADEMTL